LRAGSIAAAAMNVITLPGA